MVRSLCRITIFLFLAAAVLGGCATILPPEYGSGGGVRELPGPILALDGKDGFIIAANGEGIYTKDGNGEWKRWEIPGIKDYRRVTTLAVRGSEVCVGTEGEGLHIYRDGTWEVRTARYGGLPDDSVLSIAYDGSAEGLPGDNLWVGTREGITLRRDGEWSVYMPGKNWLTDMAGDEPERKDKTYLGPGYDLGGKGEDSKYFRPPVTAIGVGPDSVVFGNPNSQMAIVAPYGTATIFFTADAEITSLRAEKGIIWAGTNGGLLWGGLEGVAEGTPWPTLRLDATWNGRLFGTRNTQPFQYRWHLVGYNITRVPFMSLSEDSLWVVYGKPDSKNPPRLAGDEGETVALNPDVRRYVNIKEYITRKEAFVFERYNKNAGISGYPGTVLPLPERGELWVGTTKGLYRLEK